ncbi:MAG: ABC transporter ATP-binding protein [Chthonomonadales bacterium]
MSEVAISAEGISKRYRIGACQERYRTLRDTLVDGVLAPFRAVAALGRGRRGEGDEDTIWSLRDVSFQVEAGEVVGIIGRNGAGKSTLLKILSRITEPTEGHARIHGRVGSLLEVGTGFHLELTGRENIYLNGAILGMKRREIERKFDEIVDFAEVARFIDTPVKHYSTGMHLRLAFAVAAHLEPDILLVDEVLAVGDLAFQRKCLGKMENVAAHGRTVLFVSHNLGAVKELCQTSIVLEQGRIVFRGDVVEGIARYTQGLAAPASSADAQATGWMGVSVSSSSDGPIPGGEPFQAEAYLDVAEPLNTATLYCIVDDSNGNCVAHHFIRAHEMLGGPVTPGRYRVVAQFPPLWLVPDAYTVSFKLIGMNALGFSVRHVSERAILDVTDLTGQMDGKVRARLIPPLEWKVAPVSAATEIVPALVINGQHSRQGQEPRKAGSSNA